MNNEQWPAPLLIALIFRWRRQSCREPQSVALGGADNPVGNLNLWRWVAPTILSALKSMRMGASEQFPHSQKSELLRFRRNLPHFEVGGRTLHVTWRCRDGVELNSTDRAIVLDCIRHFHADRYLVGAAVVMLDLVHMLIQPLEREAGKWWNLGYLLKGIKGVSARRINEARQSDGSVWQDERYDRLIRSATDYSEKWNYIRENPLREGLVDEKTWWDGLWLPYGPGGVLRSPAGDQHSG